MCPCYRTFWEVGHKGNELFAEFVTTVSKSRSQFLMPPCSWLIGEKDFLQFYKDAMPI